MDEIDTRSSPAPVGRQCADTLSHFFATRMLEAGLGHITVEKLMGHADATMLACVYQHIGESNDFLVEQLKLAASNRSGYRATENFASSYFVVSVVGTFHCG